MSTAQFEKVSMDNGEMPRSLSMGIIYYNADTPVTQLRLLTNVSGNIAALSLAALTHRLARFQLTSPLAYINAQLYRASPF